MPKKISYKQLSENTFEFENQIKLTKNYSCLIRPPVDLGRKLLGKKLRVTIEVIDE